MIYKTDLKVGTTTNEKVTNSEERLVIGDYELILKKEDTFRFLSFKKGKKIKNLLGSVLGIALFEEIKFLREENKKLKETMEKLRRNKDILADEL